MTFRKRRFFRRRINGKLSRKHYTWVTALNNVCNITNLAECETPTTEPPTPFCCPSQAQLVLIDNAVIQSSFQDTIRVVRVHGEIGWSWNFGEVLAALGTLFETCDSFSTGVLNYFNSGYAKLVSGIAVRELHGGDQLTLPRMNPVEDYDFAEGRWKMMRFHTRMPDNHFTGVIQCESSATQQGVCANVTGTSPGATSTICSAFPLPDSVISHGTQFATEAQVKPWTFRYNNRCSLRIRENQEPVMSVGWTWHNPGNPTLLPQPSVDMLASLKLLIEVG